VEFELGFNDKNMEEQGLTSSRGYCTTSFLSLLLFTFRLRKTGDFDAEIPTQSKFPIICMALSEKNEGLCL